MEIRLTPRLAESLDSGFAAIEHVCEFKSDKTLSCWGKNEYGGSDPPDGHFIQVSSRGGYSCGIKTDHTLICWGNDNVGKASPLDGLSIHESYGVASYILPASLV